MKKVVFILILILTGSLTYSNKIAEVKNMATEINLSQAQELLNFGIDIANHKNLSLSIAVVDASGYLICFSKMDDAALVTIDVAIGKAKTAAFLKAPSKVFEDKVNAGETAMLSVPNILPLQGGIPIIVNNKVIGAIGVSGSTGNTDNEIAEAIVSFFNNQQKKQ